MDTEKWFNLIDGFCEKYLDLQSLTHNEKLCLAICLGAMENKREEDLRQFANRLIYAPKINSNALSDAGISLMEILNQGED